VVGDLGLHQILFYEYVADVLERRGPYREAHLAALRAEREAGRLRMAGAIGDPPDGAVIVFQGVTPEFVADYARSDPYVEGGLVTSWRVEPWNVVV
jgi:uncharacterized protein YciI